MKVYVIMQVLEGARYLDSIYEDKDDAIKNLKVARKLSLHENTGYKLETHEVTTKQPSTSGV